MKKKIFALITIVALVAILCLSLVACNEDDSDNLPTIKFKDSMTADEIVEELEKVKNCTLEIHTSYDGADATYYMGQSFWVTKYVATDYDGWFWEFVDGNRGYEIEVSQGEDTSEDYIYICDFSGYDVAELDFNGMVEEHIDWLADLVEEGECVVVDGNLKYVKNVTGDSESYTVTYVLKDCNKTKMPSMPDKYKDYKDMDANQDLIEYELSDDGTYYSLVNMNYLIKTFEVPETYNGKPVKEFTESCSSENITTLTLPTSIVKVGYCYHYTGDGELHVIYKGTKEQWEQVENHEEWDIGVRVTCSDGDYVVTTQE